MRKKLLVANWKMNPETEAEALELFSSIAGAARTAKNVSVVVAPPFPFLAVLEKRWGIKVAESRHEAFLHLAAQDLFWEREGAYTGEVSPLMEKELGVTYVIVGHSERRKFLGETNEMVAKKMQRAFEYGLSPILCIGEESRAGDDIPEFIATQLQESIAGLPPLFLESLIIAYEPVWAISRGEAGKAASPSDMHKAAIYIRKTLIETYGERYANEARILYGGSVNAENAASFFLETEGEVAGLLVGSTSLNGEQFTKIIERLDQLPR